MNYRKSMRTTQPLDSRFGEWLKRFLDKRTCRPYNRNRKSIHEYYERAHEASDR